jgi:UDP-3-O-acyl-N-acetylglucosamine deacetylase
LLDSNKLRVVNKLVNQFTSSIKHKPFHNELDKARTLAFISALRNVLKGVVKSPVLEAKPLTIPIENQQEINKEGLDVLRKRMRGKANELDG